MLEYFLLFFLLVCAYNLGWVFFLGLWLKTIIATAVIYHTCKLLVSATVGRYQMWKHRGEHLVLERRVKTSAFHYFYPCHTEATIWLRSNGFSRSILTGGFIVPDEEWIRTYKGLRDDVGCVMEVEVRI